MENSVTRTNTILKIARSTKQRKGRDRSLAGNEAYWTLSLLIFYLLMIAMLLLTPIDSFAQSKYVAVAEGNYGAVFRFNPASGALIDILQPVDLSGNRILGSPVDVTFGPDGNLYVADTTHPFHPSIPLCVGGVMRFDGKTGAFLGVFASGNGLCGPQGVRFGPDGNLYVSDVANRSGGAGQVLRFDGKTGGFIDAFVPPNGTIIDPAGLAFGPDNNLYVATGVGTIARFDGQTGDFLGVFATTSFLANYLTFGISGNLYVAHRYMISGAGVGDVLEFNGSTGALMRSFVPTGSAGLNCPWGLAFGPDGNLYVSNSCSHGMILRFQGPTKSAPGAFIDVFVDFFTLENGNFSFARPGGLAFSPAGCQVNLTRFFHQSDDPQPYFGPPSNNPPCSTVDKACALMTYSNMLTSFNNPSLDYTPTKLNAALLDHNINGYASCSLLSGKIPQAVHNLIKPTRVLHASFAPGTLPPPGIDDFIDEHFCQNDERVILVMDEYINGNKTPKGSHYILVTGKNDLDWKIADPGWLNASPMGALDSLQEHYVGFTTFSNNNPSNAVFHQFTVSEVRAYAVGSAANPSSLTITALSPLELVLTDAQCERLGYDPHTGTYFDEIAEGNYYRDFPLASDDTGEPPSGDPTGIKTVYITNPQEGIYNLDASGNALGSYTLTFQTIIPNGSSHEISFTGLTDVGMTSTFQVTYSPKSASPTVVRVTTFQSTLDDINNSLKLELIDNGGIANSLLQKIQSARDAAARGQTQAAWNMLVAFKNEVNAQTGKRLTGIAPQVLLQDADSLLSQLR